MILETIIITFVITVFIFAITILLGYLTHWFFSRNNYHIQQTIFINQKGKEIKTMVQFQLDQHAIWKLNFLNDNGVAVEVASFEVVSFLPAIIAEVLPVDPATWTYSVKISASEVAAGEIQAKGTTASGNELPISLAVSTIPDEAESVTSNVEVVEND